MSSAPDLWVPPGAVPGQEGTPVGGAYQHPMEHVQAEDVTMAARPSCPVCQGQLWFKRKGWGCNGCGAKGGWYPGGRMYISSAPATPAGQAARARLAASG